MSSVSKWKALDHAGSSLELLRQEADRLQSDLGELERANRALEDLLDTQQEILRTILDKISPPVKKAA